MTIRGPLITPVASRRVPQQPSIAGNLLLTTLAVVGAAQAPFNKSDWPNPVNVKQVQQPQGTANLQTTTLAPAGVVQAPFRQQDWQNPARLPVSLARHVLVTTSFYTEPVAVPGIPVDFQNPTVGRKVQQPQILPNLVLSAAFPPIRPFDYQNPVRARAVQQNHVFQDLVLNTLFTVPAVPKVSAEFQNPVIARQVQQPQVLPNLVLGTLFVPPATTPAIAFGFENPRVNRVVQQPLVFPNLALTVASAPTPFRQMDWQNPVLTKRRMMLDDYQRFAIHIVASTDVIEPPASRTIRGIFRPRKLS